MGVDDVAIFLVLRDVAAQKLGGEDVEPHTFLHLHVVRIHEVGENLGLRGALVEIPPHTKINNKD